MPNKEIRKKKALNFAANKEATVFAEQLKKMVQLLAEIQRKIRLTRMIYGK